MKESTLGEGPNFLEVSNGGTVQAVEPPKQATKEPDLERAESETDEIAPIELKIIIEAAEDPPEAPAASPVPEPVTEPVEQPA